MMMRSTDGMSRPRDARSVATRMRVVRARKDERFEVRVVCGRPECREVKGWEREESVRDRWAAVRVRLQKIIVLSAELCGVERRTWRYDERWVVGVRRYV